MSRSDFQQGDDVSRADSETIWDTARAEARREVDEAWRQAADRWRITLADLVTTWIEEFVPKAKLSASQQERLRAVIVGSPGPDVPTPPTGPAVSDPPQ